MSKSRLFRALRASIGRAMFSKNQMSRYTKNCREIWHWRWAFVENCQRNLCFCTLSSPGRKVKAKANRSGFSLLLLWYGGSVKIRVALGWEGSDLTHSFFTGTSYARVWPPKPHNFDHGSTKTHLIDPWCVKKFEVPAQRNQNSTKVCIMLVVR